MNYHKTTAPVVIYTKGYCPFCRRAKALLDSKNVAYTEFDITGDNALTREMLQRSGRMTVPQVFVNDVHVGGSDELQTAQDNGLLDQLLASRQAA